MSVAIQTSTVQQNENHTSNLVGMGTVLLSSLSREIASGRALWALLRLNEYSSLPSPIVRALRQKISAELAGKHTGPIAALITRALDGARLSDFSAAEQERIKTAASASMSTNRLEKNFSLTTHLTNHYARRTMQRTETYGAFSRSNTAQRTRKTLRRANTAAI